MRWDYSNSSMTLMLEPVAVFIIGSKPITRLPFARVNSSI